MGSGVSGRVSWLVLSPQKAKGVESLVEDQIIKTEKDNNSKLSKLF